VSDPDGIYTLPCRIPPGRYEARAAVQVGGDPQSDLLQLLTQMQQSATTIVVLAGQETLALDILLQAR
jgi:hypothetical protein